MLFTSDSVSAATGGHLLSKPSSSVLIISIQKNLQCIVFNMCLAHYFSRYSFIVCIFYFYLKCKETKHHYHRTGNQGNPQKASISPKGKGRCISSLELMHQLTFSKRSIKLTRNALASGDFLSISIAFCKA